MDQKRILWIVAASGVFLLVVVGVALFLSAPQVQAQQTLASLQGTGNTWIKGEVKNPAQVENQPVTNDENSIPNDIASENDLSQPTDNQTITVDTVTLIAGTTNVYTQKEETKSAEKESVSPEKTSSSTTITVNTVSKEQTTPVVSKSSTTVKPADDCVETPTTTTKTTIPSNKASSSSSVTVSKPVADQYWVQVASFTGKKNAEDARAALLEEKINSEIFTYKDSKGTVYYRLRVGPYTTKSEAEYWHSRIKLIEQFAGTSSYVVNSTGKAQN